MITCTFEDGGKAKLRHAVVHAIMGKKVAKGGSEVSKVEWISFKKLLSFDEFAFDHGETIRLYLEYRKKKFKIPIIV